jgi:hypothetical protein
VVYIGSPKTNQLGNQLKHILILLSFLLLSSPVIGQETGVLYLWETSSGLQWKTFGDGKVLPKYKGEIKNGKPEGFGNLTSSDGEKYVGEWKDGKKYGQGTYIYHHGFKYVGEWKDNKKHGLGTYTLTDGNRFEGEWKDGNQWNLTILDKNGNIIGKWVNGVLQK